MGTQTYDEKATPEKIAVESAKYPPQKELGFRFTGMKVKIPLTWEFNSIQFTRPPLGFGFIDQSVIMMIKFAFRTS